MLKALDEAWVIGVQSTAVTTMQLTLYNCRGMYEVISVFLYVSDWLVDGNCAITGNSCLCYAFYFRTGYEKGAVNQRAFYYSCFHFIFLCNVWFMFYVCSGFCSICSALGDGVIYVLSN